MTDKRPRRLTPATRKVLDRFTRDGHTPETVALAVDELLADGVSKEEIAAFLKLSPAERTRMLGPDSDAQLH